MDFCHSWNLPLNDLGRFFAKHRRAGAVRTMVQTLGTRTNAPELSMWKKVEAPLSSRGLIGSNDVGVAIIAAWLLVQEMDLESFWLPYLNILPHSCQMSICWDETRFLEQASRSPRNLFSFADFVGA